ncbi:MAG: YfhO family protein [Gemmatimonadota bacterium]
MSQPDSSLEGFEPRWPAWWATLAFILAALTLCAPMLAGRFLLGDDQITVGYGFREFGADYFRQTHSIPQWIPYQFGGMPYIAAMHGDIFYPTAWLRWILPIDTAMNIGYAVHIVLAGLFMYGFLRALRLGWTAAITGGLAWELSGIVVSMMSPGHDGKLYVSALAPLAFLALLRAIRDQKFYGYPLLAAVIGLCLLSPHYQMAYYLIVALGLWTLYLVFFDPERPANIRWPIPLALALGAVVLGVGISGLQALPFLHYIPYSPRAEGGPSGGWEFAISYAFPLKELPVTILPQFSGIRQFYWGENALKAHTEYLGIPVVILAILGLGWKEKRRLTIGLGVIALLFLLVALGGHTPFFHLWYAVMPMVKKFRAPGMAYFLTAMVICVYAAFGAERLVRGEARWKPIAIGGGILGGIALLGAVGGLQAVAQAIAQPQTMGAVAQNAGELRAGSIRMLLAVLVTGGVLWLVLYGKARGLTAALALGVVVAGDLWSIDRYFFTYHPPAAVLFHSDAILDKMKEARPPFRVFDPNSLYHPSHLIASKLPTLLGYHGNEIRFYDDLLGGKGQWTEAFRNPQMWNLLGVRFLIVNDSVTVPGFHLALGPTPTTNGLSAYLYEQDTVPAYARVVTAAAKVPETQLVPTVADPRFPIESVVLYPDSTSITPDPIQGSFIPPSNVIATISNYRPGDITVDLTGSDPKNTYLLVSENWYPDWHATIDGNATPVRRADHTLLSVVLPPGARQVHFQFRDSGYATGKIVSAISVLLMTGLFLVPAFGRRRGTGV